MNRLTFKALQIFIFLMLSHALSAQKYEWTKTFGGIDDDLGTSVILDGSGNVYTTGSFLGTVDFDPSSGVDFHTSNGGKDIFVLKLDSSGNFLWAKTFGGIGDDFGASVSVDSSGNIYTIGFFLDSVDFDPSTGVDYHTSNGGFDVFIQKLDSLGNFQWAKTFGGTYFEIGEAITVDGSGNVYTTGSFEASVDFDPSSGVNYHSSNGSNDIFIQKLDSSGNFIWAKTFGGTDRERGSSISLDGNGSLYTTGLFSDTVDFDPSTGIDIHNSSGFSDIFIQKLDTSGNFIWAKTFGGTRPDFGTSIFVDGGRDVYTTGGFEGTMDFDPSAGIDSHSFIGKRDVFVQKLDSAGKFIWAKTFGGTELDQGNSISVDGSGNVYTIGSFGDTVDFDPTDSTNIITSNGLDDIFIHILDSSGSFIGVKTFGGVSYDYGRSISVGSYGNVYSTGIFARTVDFDPSAGVDSQSSTGGYSIFVHKLSYSSYPQSVVKTVFDRSIGIYPNPSDGHFTVDLGEKYRNINVRITDVTGRLIKSQEYSNAQILNFSITEPNGVYLLTLESEEHKAVIRLMLK